MLLGKELTGFVKGLVAPNKNIQGHITQGTSLHGMNIHMLASTLANNKLPGQGNARVLSVFPDLLTTVSETNYLMDVNTDENPNLSLWESNGHTTLRSPLSNGHWSCMGPSCWGPAVENIRPKTTCGGCPWHQGLLPPLAPVEWWV